MLGTFRDPDGFVIGSGDRILRCVLPHASQAMRAFLDSPVHREWSLQGLVCATRVLAEQEDPEIRSRLPTASVLLEHRPIWFPNYPSEWAPEMLHAAADLTLRLARQSLLAGFGLKDATPHNLMFEGAQPVFVDLLSFAQLQPEETVWRPYAQFVRTFLYPLMACRYFGSRLDEIFSIHADGLDTARMRRMVPAWRLLTPPFLGLVTMPSIGSGQASRGGASRYRPRTARDRAEAEFVQARLLRQLERRLAKLARFENRRSEVSRYEEDNCPYSAAEFAAKTSAVEDALQRFGCSTVLDVGCNTGRFSLLAAQGGARVVAVDRDPDAVGRLWKRARTEGAALLPLVVDLARPTPALGWENAESSSFLSRARGRFDCVLMLGLLHHLLVTDRVPADRILDLAAGLTTNLLLLEYVGRDDPQFVEIARGREELHRDWSCAAFESAARQRFEIVGQVPVCPARRIYVLRKRGS